MEPELIFGIQFILSLVVLGALAFWYIAPWLSTMTKPVVLTILIVPHAFRHIGLSFQVPNLNSGGLPEFFATTAGYGDLAAGIVAFAALAALKWRLTIALPLVWLFNTVGLVDLVNALRQAEAIQYFGPTWFIPTFLVPLLIITHIMVFAFLMKRDTSRHAFAS